MSSILNEKPKASEEPVTFWEGIAGLSWGVVILLGLAILYGLSLNVFVDWFLVSPGMISTGITVAQAIGIYMIVNFLKVQVVLPTKEWNAQPRWFRNWWGAIFQIVFLGAFWISAILVHLILL